MPPPYPLKTLSGLCHVRKVKPDNRYFYSAADVNAKNPHSAAFFPSQNPTFALDYQDSLYTMKVTVVGAGNVGASCAEYIAIKSIASEVVLLDIKEGFAEGKASNKAVSSMQV